MRTLIQAAMERLPGNWDTALVIGAGTGAGLSILEEVECARLLLVEPDPEQAEQLAQAIRPSRNERALQLAITGSSSGEAVIHRCSIPRFSGLAPASGLAAHLPNLRYSEARVPAVTLHDLMLAEHVDPTARNLLVVESAGQLAQAIADPESLLAFAALILKAGEEPLYEGDRDLVSLHAVLRDAGFDHAGDDPDAIYPFTSQLFLRNDERTWPRRIRELLGERDQQMKLAASLKDELRRSGEEFQKELSSLQVACETTDAQLLASLEEAQRLRQEAEALKSALENAQGAQTAATALLLILRNHIYKLCALF